MEEVLYYLELKNTYYEKFLSITEKFLSQIQQDHWENMDYFVDNRERILNIIRSYDFKIAELFHQIDVGSTRLENYSSRVKELLERREVLGKKIMDQDLELIGKIDEVRTETIRDLQKTQDTIQKVHSFSSAPATPRRKLNKDIWLSVNSVKSLSLSRPVDVAAARQQTELLRFSFVAVAWSLLF